MIDAPTLVHVMADGVQVDSTDVLILGASGYLGVELCRHAQSVGSFCAVGRP